VGELSRPSDEASKWITLRTITTGVGPETAPTRGVMSILRGEPTAPTERLASKGVGPIFMSAEELVSFFFFLGFWKEATKSCGLPTWAQSFLKSSSLPIISASKANK